MMIAMEDNENTGNASYIPQFYYYLTTMKTYFTYSELGKDLSIRGVNDSWLPRPELGGIPSNVRSIEREIR